MNAQLETVQANRFIKIGRDGKPLPATATFDDGWEVNACQRYGRMWVAKTADLVKVPNWKPATIKKVEAQLRKLRLGGFDDWRIPEIEELFLLHDRTRFNPAIDIGAFPDCPIDWFWSKSDYTPASRCAWFVGSGSGFANGAFRSDGGFVRAVRGGECRICNHRHWSREPHVFEKAKKVRRKHGDSR